MHISSFQFEILLLYVVDVVSFISGFVVWQVKKLLNAICICALTSTDHTSRLVTQNLRYSNPQSGLMNASPGA